MPGALRDHAHREPIALIRPAETILHKHVFAFEKLERTLEKTVEMRLAHGLVD